MTDIANEQKPVAPATPKGGSRGDAETIPVTQQTIQTLTKRVLELLFLLLFISTLLFFLLRLTGDPAAVLASETGDQ